MKATVNRAALADAVKWVTGAISTRPPHPTLAGLHITATDGTLILVGHNYDQSHTAVVDAEVTEPGVVIPVGFMLRDLLGALKGDTVNLADTDNKLGLKAGRAAYAVALFAAETWVDFPTANMQTAGTVDADDLRTAIATAVSAAGKDAYVPVLTGLRLEGEPGALRVVGCNRLRLAVGYCTTWGGGELTALPTATSLVDALRGMTGPVAVAVSDGLLGLDCGTRAVIVRLLDGEYPAWSRLLKPSVLEVQVDADGLRDAVKRATLAVDQGGAIDMVLSADGLTVSAVGETSAGSETIDVTGPAGDYTISWTATTLTPALAALPSGPVILGFGGDSVNPPMRIYDADRTFDHLVMPKVRT